ncbi:MAG: hypothetical protein EBS53_14770 [Bacteroidetes bacterium]|nr:hypothetical protein [Bacteroidota bacterium]
MAGKVVEGVLVCDVVLTVVADGMVDDLVLEESPPHAPETTTKDAMTNNMLSRRFMVGAPTSREFLRNCSGMTRARHRKLSDGRLKT